MQRTRRNLCAYWLHLKLGYRSSCQRTMALTISVDSYWTATAPRNIGHITAAVQQSLMLNHYGGMSLLPSLHQVESDCGLEILLLLTGLLPERMGSLRVTMRAIVLKHPTETPDGGSHAQITAFSHFVVLRKHIYKGLTREIFCQTNNSPQSYSSQTCP